MWIYVWDSEIKNIYLWDTPVKEVYLWDTKIRPTWPDKDYLCFTANSANSTVKLAKEWNPTAVVLETSTDWRTWTSYTIGDTITLTNVGDKVYRRNTSETDTAFSNGSAWYYFVMSWSISGSWDTNFLLNKNSTNAVPAYSFLRLFRNCASLTTAPELPASTIGQSSYYYMFQNCTSLTTSPKVLPATSLVSTCYWHMFDGCSSLTTAPELPATTLANACYFQMFSQCANLEVLPKLPATSLTTNCYNQMFGWCSKIKLSTTNTWEYQTAYRIPTSWTGTTGSNSLANMFTNTWWTFAWAPTINTTYYTSNTVV